MAPSTAPIAGGLLDKVLKAGELRSSRPTRSTRRSPSSSPTAPTRASTSTSATEIAKRLGVDIAFETPDWYLITAGWLGRVAGTSAWAR